MKTKYYITLILISGLFSKAMGQQFPYYNHIYLNQTIINPSLTGLGDQMDLMLINRSTLTGMPENPSTFYLNLNGPIKANKVGVGFNLYSENLGITHKTGVYGSYAYRLNIEENQSLNLGFTLGALQFSIDPDMANTDNANDPLLVNKSFRQSAIDGAIGATYINNRFEAGLSVLQMFGRRINLANDVNYKLEENVVGTFKYKMFLNQKNDLSLTPMVVARYSKSVLPQDILLIMNYRDKFWFVPSYNSVGVIGVSASVKLYNSLRIGYAHETFIKQPISRNQRGGNEIMVGYSFNIGSKSFNKQQEEIDNLYKRLDKLEKAQFQKDSIQDQRIKDNTDGVAQNKDSIQNNNSELEKTRLELEKLKRELIESGVIRESPISEYENGVAGYYIVIASVKNVRYNQAAMDREYLSKGYKKIYNIKRGWHYVYTVKPDDFASALRILKETRAGIHKTAWIHILK